MPKVCAPSAGVGTYTTVGAMMIYPEEAKIEISMGEGYWHEWAFVDLRPDDVFRYVSQRWVEYTVTSLPFRNKDDILAVRIHVEKTQIRKGMRLMATIKKGLTEQAREWWKHLRPFGKRDFWKRQRRADKAKLREEP